MPEIEERRKVGRELHAEYLKLKNALDYKTILDLIWGDISDLQHKATEVEIAYEAYEKWSEDFKTWCDAGDGS